MINLSMHKASPVARKTDIAPSEWFVRDFGAEESSQALPWHHAFRTAAQLSQTNESGLAEIFTYIRGTMYVVGVFLRGKWRIKGRQANSASTMDLPPRMWGGKK